MCNSRRYILLCNKWINFCIVYDRDSSRTQRVVQFICSMYFRLLENRGLTLSQNPWGPYRSRNMCWASLAMRFYPLVHLAYIKGFWVNVLPALFSYVLRNKFPRDFIIHFHDGKMFDYSSGLFRWLHGVQYFNIGKLWSTTSTETSENVAMFR